MKELSTPIKTDCAVSPFELVQYIFNKQNVKLVVSNQIISEHEDAELAEDVLAISTCFAARKHGQISRKRSQYVTR